MNRFSLNLNGYEKQSFVHLFFGCVWIFVSWVVQQGFISALQQKSMIILNSMTSLTVESTFVLIVLAEVCSTVFPCNSSCYNEHEGLSRFFCFTGIMLYRLCLETMDYSLVQNSFIILKICLVTKLSLKVRKYFCIWKIGKLTAFFKVAF